jgi:hypothetical protein
MTTVAEAFAVQIDWCRRLSSPFTAAVLEWALADLAAGGPVADILGRWPGPPIKDALALRWAGAMHALVLAGKAPTLARLYPRDDEARAPNTRDLGAALAAVNREHAAWIGEFLRSPPQTNETGRAAVLVGGFLEIARQTRLPIRALEIGASAGLNTHWDRFRYRLGGAAWGEPSSPVRLAPAWSGPSPAIDAPLVAARRAACDLSPIDLADPASRQRLRAYVWPDQPARLAQLDAAIGLALAAGTRVEQADAADWTERALAELRPGEATVLYHSIMWHYLPGETQARLRASIEDAGRRASVAAPFFWLQFEVFAAGANPELRLAAWPGGATSVLARAHHHGSSVEWLAV